MNNVDLTKRNGSKAISPMHIKLYASTMQKTGLTIKLPTSHPSYNKDPPNKNIIPQTTKKRLDLLKTNYNFLKNYY